MIAIYLRNLILNFIVLTAAFAFVLLIPRLVTLASRDLVGRMPLLILEGVAIAALMIAASCIILSMRYFAPRRSPERSSSSASSRIPESTKVGWIRRCIDFFTTRKRTDESPLVRLPDISEWIRSDDGIAWYPSKLVERDFILRLEFEVKATGDQVKAPDDRDRYIYVWTPMKRGATTRGRAGAAARIRVSADETINPSPEFKTGSINSQPPVRRAEVIPGRNTLKIICSEERCTVYINDLTLNTLRVHREKARGIFRWRTCLAIGLQDDEKFVTFSDMTLEKVETPLDTGSTQGQVQRRIIAPLFLAAFLGNFHFWLWR